VLLSHHYEETALPDWSKHRLAAAGRLRQDHRLWVRRGVDRHTGPVRRQAQPRSRGHVPGGRRRDRRQRWGV